MTSRHFILFVLVALSTAASAQPFLGGRAGAASRFGTGAEGIGTGNSRSAHAAGDVGFAYNPALIAFQRSATVMVGTSFLSLDRSLNALSYATPLPPTAGLALSVMNAGVSEIDGRNSIGERTSSYSVSENAFGLTFGLRPTPRLALGVSTKLLYYRMIEGLSSTTVGVDAGASYLVNDELTLGAVFRDINSKYRWDTSKLYGRNGRQTTDLFPRRAILAVRYAPSWFDASASAEWEYVASGSLFRAGIESRIHPLVVLRTGVDGLNPEKALGVRWSAGMTVENTGLLWNPSFDYAFVVEPWAPSPAHMISLRLHLKE
jgi:hypothetical protein